MASIVEGRAAARAAGAQSKGATYSHGNAVESSERAPRIVSSAGGVVVEGLVVARGSVRCTILAAPGWGRHGRTGVRGRARHS